MDKKVQVEQVEFDVDRIVSKSSGFQTIADVERAFKFVSIIDDIAVSSVDINCLIHITMYLNDYDLHELGKVIEEREE